MMERRLDERYTVLAERFDHLSRADKRRRAAALFYSHRDWDHHDDCVRSSSAD